MANVMHNVLIIRGQKIPMARFFNEHVKDGKFSFSSIVPLTEEDENCLNGAGYAAWGCPGDPEDVTWEKHTDKSTTEAVLILQFLTKWAVPNKFYAKLLELFPDFDFNAVGYDQGCDVWYEGRNETRGVGSWQELNAQAHFRIFTREAKVKAWIATGLITEPQWIYWKALLEDTDVIYELTNIVDVALGKPPVLRILETKPGIAKDDWLWKHEIPF